MIIDLKVTPEETDKILMGLEALRGDLTLLSNRLVEDARRQISEKQAEEAKEIEENQKNKKENGEKE